MIIIFIVLQPSNYQPLEGIWSFRVSQGHVQSRGTLPISQKVGIVMMARPASIHSKGILLPEGIRTSWKIRQNKECSCLFTEKAQALPPKCLPQTRNIHPSRTKRKKPHSKAVSIPSQQFFTQRVNSNKPHPKTVRAKLILPVNSVSFLSAILPKRVLPKVDPIPKEIMRYPANLLISSLEVPSQAKIRWGISDEQNPRATPSITRTSNNILILGKKCRTCFNIFPGLYAGTEAAAAYTKLPSQEAYISD